MSKRDSPSILCVELGLAQFLRERINIIYAGRNRIKRLPGFWQNLPIDYRQHISVDAAETGEHTGRLSLPHPNFQVVPTRRTIPGLMLCLQQHAPNCGACFQHVALNATLDFKNRTEIHLFRHSDFSLRCNRHPVLSPAPWEKVNCTSLSPMMQTRGLCIIAELCAPAEVELASA